MKGVRGIPVLFLYVIHTCEKIMFIYKDCQHSPPISYPLLLPAVLTQNGTNSPMILNYFWTLLFSEKKRAEGGGGRETEREICWHLSMHSLVAFCMCPDWGSNPQPWCIQTML